MTSSFARNAVLLVLLTGWSGSASVAQEDTSMLPLDMVPCYTRCLERAGGNMFPVWGGREYTLVDCYVSSPGICTCVWVTR